MKFEEQIVGSIYIISVFVERATLYDADEFKKIVNSRIDEGYVNVVIDLSEVEYLDSTFLGNLVSLLKRSVRVDGDLKLVGFKPNVRSMFELTRMFRVFESFSSVDEAIKSFNK